MIKIIGLTSNEIAVHQHKSVATVERHLAKAKTKAANVLLEHGRIREPLQGEL